MKEIWNPIEGFPDYMISNLGRVKSYKLNKKNGRFLSICANRYNYNYVMLRDKSGKKRYKTIHQLVAQAFVPNPENKPQVNHIDGNKQNNIYNNLEWVTARENTLHACDIGLRKNDFKEKSVAQIDKNGVVLQVFNSLKEAARHLGLYNAIHIVEFCKCIRPNCIGYRWKYYGGEINA